MLNFKVLELDQLVTIEFTNGTECTLQGKVVVPFNLWEWFMTSYPCTDAGVLTDYCKPEYRLDAIPDNVNQVAVFMELALGDALMISPTVRSFHKIHGTSLDFFVSAGADEILSLNPDVHKATSFPVQLDEILQYKCIMFLSHGLDQCFDPNYDAIETVSKYMGFPLDGDYSLACQVPAQSVFEWKQVLRGQRAIESSNHRRLKICFDKPGLPLVYWQLATSSWLRTYPMQKLLEAAELVAKSGKANCVINGLTEHIAMFVPDYVEQEDGRVTYTMQAYQDMKSVLLSSEFTPKITDMLGLIANASVVVSADSVAVHMASALRKPLVALYVSVPPKSRLKFNSRAKIMGSKSDLACCPCWDKFRLPCVNPDDYGFGRCFESITPAMIAEEVLNLL